MIIYVCAYLYFLPILLCPSLYMCVCVCMCMYVSVCVCVQYADVTLAPLTISYDRESYIDFTKPFMDLGLTILMAREVEPNQLFAFFFPFDWALWGCILGAFITISLLTTALRYVLCIVLSYACITIVSFKYHIFKQV